MRLITLCHGKYRNRLRIFTKRLNMILNRSGNKKANQVSAISKKDNYLLNVYDLSYLKQTVCILNKMILCCLPVCKSRELNKCLNSTLYKKNKVATFKINNQNKEQLMV